MGQHSGSLGIRGLNHLIYPLARCSVRNQILPPAIAAAAITLAAVPGFTQPTPDTSKQPAQSLSHADVSKQPAQSLSHSDVSKQTAQSLSHPQVTKQATQSLSHSDPTSVATKQQ
jgi:hypothetical protein